MKEEREKERKRRERSSKHSGWQKWGVDWAEQQRGGEM